MKDKELIDIIKSDKEKGFALFFDLYSQRVFTTVINLVRNVEEAEELTQDTFVTVYQKIESFRQKSKLSTWVYRIAVNKCLDAIKSKKRNFRLKQVQSLFMNVEVDAIEYTHPGIIAEQNELSQYLFQALTTLPLKQQVAYTLSKIEGKSNKEVGGIMEVSVSSVESLLIRGKANLRKELGAYYESNFK